MSAMTIDIETVAGEAYGWFERAERPDGETFTRLKDGAPDWLSDLVYEAHNAGDMLPDDWRYACIRAVIGAVHDDGEDDAHEFADSYVDAYTAARFAWLASDLRRQGYIDDAISELGMEPTGDVAAMIGWGQYMEAREVFESVVESLEAEVSRREDESGDES